MFKMSSLVFSMIFVFFIGYVVISTDPHERLERACQPVDWMGNLTLSLVAFVKPDAQAGVNSFFEKTDYACQYTLWRLLHEKDYKAAQGNDQ